MKMKYYKNVLLNKKLVNRRIKKQMIKLLSFKLCIIEKKNFGLGISRNKFQELKMFKNKLKEYYRIRLNIQKKKINFYKWKLKTIKL